MGIEGTNAQGALQREHEGRWAGTSRRATGAIALLSSVVAMGAWATTASAARGHEFAGSFGWGVFNGDTELQRCDSPPPPDTPVCDPGLQGNGPGQFHEPAGIAVNEATGEVYVVDEANDRVEIFNASGSKFEGEFDGSGTHASEGKAAGSGGEAEEVATGKFDEPEGIAVDNDPSSPSFGDVYVVDTAGGEEEPHVDQPVVDKFSSSGKYLGQITRNPGGEFPESGFRKVRGVAVDLRGEVWVEEQSFGGSPAGAANYTSALANKWIAFRSTENAVSAVPGPGFAVDSEGNLYVHNTFGSGNRLARFSEAGQLLSAEVDEEAPTGVAVDLTSDDVYVAHAGNVHRLSSSLVPLETLKAPGVPSFSGVAVNSSTLTVYAAETEANRVDVFAPEAPRRPTVQEASTAVSDVTASSASFSAEVNPRSEPNEEATSYTFQYGPCPSAPACPSTAYTQSTPSPEGTLAPNYEPDPISAHPQILSPHTVYHMRVSAHNSHGEIVGEELIFTTQGTGSIALPDHREWELVSPPDKHGALLYGIEGAGLVQGAANGEAFGDLANAPTEAEPQGFSQTVQLLSRRTPAGWQSEDISTPHEATVGFSQRAGPGEYRFFSEDLTSAIVTPFGPFTRAISPQASERTPYLRTNFSPGDPSHPCSSSCYLPLVSGCPQEGEPCPAAVQEVANVPAGTEFGEEGGLCRQACGVYFLGASANASHSVFTSPTPLNEEAPALKEGETEGFGLYEWSAGKLSLVSVLPGGQAAKPDTRPGLGFVNGGNNVRIARHAISSDGSRVIWSERAGAHHLYLHEQTGEEARTIELDAPEVACTAKGKCGGEAQPIFQTASADDSRIFFTDSQALTQSSGNSDLYECEIEEAEGELSCKLSDLTPPSKAEAGAGVLGLIAGASEDGTAVYFTANGKLSEGPSARGEEAVAGDCGGSTQSGTPESETAPQRCNLYASAGGQTKLVAVLSGADFPDWSLREGRALRTLSTRVSPDGRYLTFMSRRSLSGYDNLDAASGKPDEEVFLYDNGANGGQGGLLCASCDPSGGRPRGVQYKEIDSDEGGLAGGSGVWPPSAWIAASIPGWTALSAVEGFALYQSRYLADSGRLFFNAADALVPQDANKTEDVYEYEPTGAGDCDEAKSTFGAASGGCVSLISAGTAKEESAFLDASESGDDVFFLTGQRLLPGQDFDQSLDVYDAHACSASSPCLPEAPTPMPACEGDSCQSPGAPPEDQTPGSLSFQGPGNPAPPAALAVKPKTPAQIRAEKLKKALTACRKDKSKRKRSACEAKARKLYGPKKAKKAKQGKKSSKSSRGRR